MAICEYLEERFPTPAILPRDPAGRARVRAITLNIACEIHPLANRRTQVYLGERFKLDETTAANGAVTGSRSTSPRSRRC